MELPAHPMSPLFTKRNPPVALTIGGSDCSSGAGIQADLKTFGACGVYGLTALTCIVAEVPGKVKAVHAVKPTALRQQIEILFENFPIRAVKTGMLYSAELIHEVAAALERVADWRDEELPLVVDPVMVATSGDPLMTGDAVKAYKEVLFPLADLITPNLDEVRVLTGIDVTDYQGMKSAGAQLVETYKCGFVVKGGHLGEQEGVARDYLMTEQGAFRLEAPYTAGFSSHGTGCTFSAALTAHLALGQNREDATESAKKFVTSAISRHFKWDLPGADASVHALNHFASS